MFVYDSMTYWDKKKHVLEVKKVNLEGGLIVLGLLLGF